VLTGSGGAKPSRTLRRADAGGAAAAGELGTHRRSLQPALALEPSPHAPGGSSGVAGAPAPPPLPPPPPPPPLALPAPLPPPCARLRLFLCAEGTRRGLLAGGGATLGARLDASPPPQGARPARLLLRLLAMLLPCPSLPPPASRHGGAERSASLRSSCFSASLRSNCFSASLRSNCSAVASLMPACSCLTAIIAF